MPMQPPARRTRILLILTAVSALLAALPWLLSHEQRELDFNARLEAPGQFIQLADGWVHYRHEGDQARPALVLVHGFNGPMSTFKHNIEVFAQAGFQVLSYDLYGRGFSDRPPLEYDLDLFDRQLGELLVKLEVKPPVTLIGSSFGCIVASEYALRHPGQVERLVLVGPAGFPSPADRMAGILSIPILSHYLYSVIGDRQMLGITRKYFVAPERFPEAEAAFREQISFHGYKRAALSTLRNTPLRDYSTGWRRVGASGLPVLLIWGREDVSFPYANHVDALELMPQAQLVTVEAAAHLPQYEQPEVVNAAVLAFLGARAD